MASEPEFWQKQGMIWRRETRVLDELLEIEIQNVVVRMATADESQCEYLLGLLTGLIWALSEGAIESSVALETARGAWVRARQPGR